jgi:hypothetical protein
VSFASSSLEEYFHRAVRPRDGQLDAAYQFQVSVLRDILGRLEVILDDEGVPRETTERVIRCMIYGTPSPADAEYRMRQQDEMMRMIARTPPEAMVTEGMIAAFRRVHG